MLCSKNDEVIVSLTLIIRIFRGVRGVRRGIERCGLLVVFLGQRIGRMPMLMDEEGSTAGTVSKIRGSVRALRVSCSMEGGSWILNRERSLVVFSLISGSGLSAIEGRGFSRSSSGL
jgi:hypothetical protein